MAEKTEAVNSDAEILRVARERYKIAEEAYVDIHSVARDDDKFSAGDQWLPEMKRKREEEARPCLTVNRLAPAINQVTNDQRQNSPSITFSPVDDNADVETAKIFQGLNRHIQSNSNAESVYDWAFNGAVRRGFGYYRITTDYISPTSFFQEILFKKIEDHFSVKLDPSHKELDGSDTNWGFVEERVQKDDFIAQYGDSKLANNTEWARCAELIPDWVNENSCLVLEYFYKDFKKTKLFLLSNDESLTEDELNKRIDAGEIPEGVTIQDERETVTAQVKWVKIAGDTILEKTDWPSRWIPIIPVYGNKIIVDGKKIFESLIRHAKDPQKMLNLWVSAETETIALAPKAPYVGPAEAFEGFESEWQSANTRTHAFLKYNQFDSKNRALQPPQRNVYEAPVQAITNARMQASDDIKATTNLYDSAMGNTSNETSGIAIQRRASQAQTGNYHFVDNLNASIKHGGRIVAELIPVIYDSARTERILGENGEGELVKINQEFIDKGQPRTYDMSRGKYDVAIDTGPNYATKRQETASSMLEIAKSVPSIMQIAPDIMVKNMDWPQSQELSERLKKTVPPHLLEQKDTPQLPPQAQAQLQQQGQMIQQLTQLLNEKTELINTKALELESKERIEFAKIEADMKLALFKANALASQAILEQEITEAQARQNLVGINEPIPKDFNGSSPDQAMGPQQPQPTGGQPGTYMGV